MKLNTIKKIMGLAIVFMLFAVSAQAAPFPLIGSRGQGMGGAGVASIEDENSGVWNPALVGQDTAFAVGIHAFGQAQVTNDFLDEVQDLQDYDDLDAIVDGRFSDTETYGDFFRLIKDLRDVNQPGQGLLVDAGGGLNFGRGNWSITANNYTSLAGYNDFQLDNIVFKGMFDDEGTDTIVRQVVTGDTDKFDLGNKKPDTYSEETVKVIKTELDNALELGGDTFEGVFGDIFESGTTSDSVANYIAVRLEEDGYSEDKVTDAILQEASKTLMPTIVSIAKGDTEDGFDTEDQRVILDGVMVNEIAFNYSYPEPIYELLSSPLYVGGSIKYMQGEIGYADLIVFDEEVEDQLDDALDNTEKSSDWAVDVGFIWDAREKMGMKLGLVGKYLNSPSFDYPTTENGPSSLTIDPQWRAGLTGYPLEWLYKIPALEGGKRWTGHDWWRIAIDYDLTTNETLLPDYETRYLAIGNEFNVFNRDWINLALRAGMRTNRAESMEGKLYTLGLGINLVRVNIDLSGTISDEKSEDEDGDDMPTFVGASANISMRF